MMRAFRRTATASAPLFFGVWIAAMTPVSAAPLAAGEPAEQNASNCGPLGCAPWAQNYQQVYSARDFRATMLTTGLMLYNHDANGALNPGALPDDSGLVKHLETGVNAPGASPGEGMLAVALILFFGLASKFRNLIV
jgi:hypothetical protein